MNNIQELIDKHDGSRFQEELGKLIVKNKLTTVIEVGHGVSSLFILKALDELGEGKLISIDKNPWFSDLIEHPRLELIKKKSFDAILDAYYMSGPFDCSCIDGEHEIGAVMYDMNMTWDFLKPGGFMVCDDTEWSNHGVFRKFLEEKNVDCVPMGSTMVIQKPLSSSYCPASEAKLRHEAYLSTALKAEEEWLAAGGVKHDAFKD